MSEVNWSIDIENASTARRNSVEARARKAVSLFSSMCEIMNSAIKSGERTAEIPLRFVNDKFLEEPYPEKDIDAVSEYLLQKGYNICKTIKLGMAMLTVEW